MFTAASIGGFRFRGFAQRPAIGTRGGILLLWDENLLDVNDIVATNYCLSASVRIRSSGICFKATTVYDPTDQASKDAFFAEIIAHKPL